MIDKKEFAKIRKELSAYEQKRENLIQSSRDVIRLSKHLIYAIHRGDMKKAEKLSKEIKSDTMKLPSEDYSTGMKRVALQEYVEAITLLVFVKTGKIAKKSSLKIDTESYLAGLADLTGELGRLSVNMAIKNKYDEVYKIKDAVEAIYGEFLQLDLRNGELRKKSDSIKWNLQKIEDMVLRHSEK